jgi:sulfatase maturation enzyme AslB (radical SAM superfamily)
MPRSSSLRTYFEGVGASLRQIVRRRPWPLEYPTVVQFPVNDICDSKCQMCNIWQQKLRRQISAPEVRNLFSSKLFHRVRSVGLNGGEPTLRHDLPDIAAALLQTMPRLRNVSLITNGLHAGRAIARIHELARAVRQHGGQLDVMVSLDGVGDVHDRVRGVPGNFENAIEVLDYVQSHPELMTVRVGCTVIKSNIYGVHELLDFCQSRGVYVKFRLGVPNRRLYNLPAPGPKTIGKRTWLDTHPFELDLQERWHFSEFLHGVADHYEPSLQQVLFYRSLAAQVMYGAPRRAGCDWQHRGVTVGSEGELLYCAVQSDVLGNGLTADPEKLYFGGRSHLEQILRSHCATCAHDYVGPPGGAQQAQLLLDRGLRLLGTDLRTMTAEGGPLRHLARVKRRVISPVRFAATRRRLLRAAQRRTSADSDNTGVLVCGWYGTETLGDKAILAAIVSLIRHVTPNERITIATLDPGCSAVTASQMAELSDCPVVSIEQAMEIAPRSRAVVFGGGPLMAIPEIALMESLFARAERVAVPRIIAGCGVGPLGPAPFNRSIAALLRLASHRIFRDLESKRAAEQLLGHDLEEAVVADDPARSWLAGLDLGAVERDSRPTLVLGLRDWPFQQYAPKLGPAEGMRIRRRFEKETIAGLEWLTSQVPDLRILPIPFCTHHVGGDDRWLYWRLIQRSASIRSATDISLLSRELTPIEYVRVWRSASAALTMRFHSLVFASALRVKATAIDYTLGSGKTHALARQMGCRSFAINELDGAELGVELLRTLNSTDAPDPGMPLFASTFTEMWRRVRTPGRAQS